MKPPLKSYFTDPYILVALCLLLILLLIIMLYREQKRRCKKKNYGKKSRDLSTEGHLILDVTITHKLLFDNLLKGFHEFAKHKGYDISFKMEDTVPTQLEFSFHLLVDTDYFNIEDITPAVIKKDLSEYLDEVCNDSSPLPEVVSFVPSTLTRENRETLISIIAEKETLVYLFFNS